jgi:hypothetical protein
MEKWRRKCSVVSTTMGVAGGEQCGNAKPASGGDGLLDSRRKKVPWFLVGPAVGSQGQMGWMLPMKIKGEKARLHSFLGEIEG